MYICIYMYIYIYIYMCIYIYNGILLSHKKRMRLPLVRAVESPLTVEQSSTGRHWNSPKKIPHMQRQRRSCSETVGRAQSQ